METRRIRRHARRHAHRTIALAASLTALGLALGMALPRSTLASAVVLVVAVSCVAIVALREDAIASTHGLHRVIRFRFRTSVSAMFESFWSRLVGTVHAVFARKAKPKVLELDEPDDEAEAWWGALPSSELLAGPLLADSVPPVPEVLAPTDPVEPEPAARTAPEPAVPMPVLAAPIPSAHVPAEDASAAPGLVEQALAASRRHLGTLTKRFRHRSEETGADLGAST
jgi:hypothetical protein